MRSEDIAELSARVLLAYYDNDIEPFLDACHPNVLWIGPGEGQIIQTQETLKSTFYAEKNKVQRKNLWIGADQAPRSSHRMAVVP